MQTSVVEFFFFRGWMIAVWNVKDNFGTGVQKYFFDFWLK